MTKVAIIGTNGLPGNYGGWDQLVKHLTNNLNNIFMFKVYTSKYNADTTVKKYNKADIIYVPFKANGWQSIPYDIYSMFHAVFQCDVLFICGTSGCIALPLLKLFGKKIILNPDGQEWKRGKWPLVVQLYLKLSEKLGVLFSDIVVADNVIIKEYLADEYNRDSKLIEYGGDQVRFVELSKFIADKYGILKSHYAFKVCRIEPENNIELILEAFAHNKRIKLVLIGNWSNSKFGIDIRNKFEPYENIIMLDPIYDQEVLDELRGNCGLYIHGHSVGGTNPSLVEAMNLGLCIVANGVNYNIETTENSALYFNSKSDLIHILAEFETNSIECLSVGENMKIIAQRRYTWNLITSKYGQIF